MPIFAPVLRPLSPGAAAFVGGGFVEAVDVPVLDAPVVDAPVVKFPGPGYEKRAE